jgi:hypothetical protein
MMEPFDFARIDLIIVGKFEFIKVLVKNLVSSWKTVLAGRKAPVIKSDETSIKILV